MIKYEPRDLDGRVNVFWNHDMLGLGLVAVAATGKMVEVVNGVQPEGQTMAGGSGDVADDLEINQRMRNGR